MTVNRVINTSKSIFRKPDADPSEAAAAPKLERAQTPAEKKAKAQADKEAAKVAAAQKKENDRVAKAATKAAAVAAKLAKKNQKGKGVVDVAATAVANDPTETNNAPSTDEDGAPLDDSNSGETNQPVDAAPKGLQVLGGHISPDGSQLNVMIVVPSITGAYDHRHIKLPLPTTTQQLADAIAGLK